MGFGCWTPPSKSLLARLRKFSEGFDQICVWGAGAMGSWHTPAARAGVVSGWFFKRKQKTSGWKKVFF